MKPLYVLNKYCGVGTAESEKAILEEIFLPFEDYNEILHIPPYSPRIIVGKKGSGKSAMLRAILNQMSSKKIPTMLIKPEDIAIDVSNDNLSLGDITRSYKYAILKSIAIKVSESISDYFADDDSDILLDLAKKEGLREDDYVEKMLKVLPRMGKDISGLSPNFFTGNIRSLNPKKIHDAVINSLDKSDKIFYLLIDDTDQIASPDKPVHLNRIWAFLLAARSITESTDNIKILITIRSEVWRRLGSEKAGQRDQVDHFRGLVYEIIQTEEKIRSIIGLRLFAATKELKYPNKGIDNYDYFFEKNHVKIPGTKDTYRYWHDFITKSSRERPRDAIQLISELIKNAEEKKFEQISTSCVEDVLPLYSKERVDDIGRETERECPSITQIIREFAFFDYDNGSFKVSADILIKNLRKLPSRFPIYLMGEVIHDNDHDILKLWKFLYEIGFINARINDSREREGYRHISVDNDPGLVSKNRWNDMQSLIWEIHPSYRSYLIKLNEEKSFTFGGATSKKKKSRK